MNSMDSEKRVKWMILMAGALIAFGGATHPLALGLVLVILGAWLAWEPCRVAVWGKLAWLWWLFIIGVLVGFLWFPGEADWRKEALALGIPLGPGLHAQPWVGVEALLAFVAASLWFSLVVAHGVKDGHRLRCLVALGVMLFMLGAVGLLGQWMGWRLPWADQVHIFSWLPNRNQTALVYASGSVLMAGLFCYHAVAGRWRMGFYAIAALVLLMACFQSLSRGALLAWCVGILVLLVAVLLERQAMRTRRLVFLPVMLLVALALFSWWGGESRDRTLHLFATVEGHEVEADFRLRVYRDAWGMFIDQPLAGAGVGQFEYVFPQYREVSRGEISIIHPESDWLWWLTELGVIGTAMVILALVLLVWRLQLGGLDNERFLRRMAFAALVPFFVHSLVDVGLHRLATVALAIVLYGLALPASDRAFRRRSSSRIRVLWRIAGVAALAMGVALMVMAINRSALLSINAPTLSSPSKTAPMRWEPYYRQAAGRMDYAPAESRANFRRARFLEPVSVELPLLEGRLLVERSTSGAYVAFNEAVKRGGDSQYAFKRVLRFTARRPEYAAFLNRLARDVPDGPALLWSAIPLNQLVKDGQPSAGLLAEWPEFSLEGRELLLRRLLGNRAYVAVIDLWEVTPEEDQSRLWRFVFCALAGQERYEEALALVDVHLPPPSLTATPVTQPEELARLQRRLVLNPDDAMIQLRLLATGVEAKDWALVRRMAERLLKNPSTADQAAHWQAYALKMENRNEAAAQAYARMFKTELSVR